MRCRAMVFGILSVLALQGMSAPVHAGCGVQLFADNGSPRFSFYLACVSKTVNCEIIERKLGDWADERQLTVHDLTPDEAARFPAEPATDQPYRVTVRYAPEMGSVSNSLESASTGAPVVSYAATVRVFDVASGKLLKTMNWHKETMVDRDQGAANPYLDAQVRDFLKHLDPTYTKPPAS
ncbi:hypothetical protein [Dyella telluris]|uniref:DUF4136 domain-containing protein n=1 Tax=Dyella telluris TaxID=2763498 RepID=A0A7G8Q905_9GAMM|nr:hypothetical protein [Dyella telluris]QNK03263.1 hypothetical protein H8F01_09235 [Dyella telluris]